MQSRRNEEHVELSPSVKFRNQHRAAGEVGVYNHDPYSVSRREVMNNRFPLPRRQRSYSPNTRNVSRRGGLGRDQMGGSMEGRDSRGWHLGNGRTEKARQKSPPYEKMHKRPHFDDVDDDGVVDGKYDYVDPVRFNDSTSSRVRRVYRYDDHGTYRMSKEKELMENRDTRVDGRVTVGQKSVEDFTVRGHRLSQDFGPSLNHVEHTGKFPLSSRDIDIGQYEHEKFQHRETIPSRKVAVMDSYKEDKPMFHSQDAAYNMMAASHSKDFRRTPQLKDFSCTSSGTPSTLFLGSYQDNSPLPVSEEYLRSSRKLTEPVGYNKYDQRPLADSVRDSEAARRNITLYKQRGNSPSRAEYEDYLYREPRAIGSNNHCYPDEDMKRMMPSQSRASFEHGSIDYDNRYMSKPNILHHVVDRIDNTDDSSGNLSGGIVWDDHTLQKKIRSDYIDMRRSYASMQGKEYLSSEDTPVEFERRLPQDYQMTHLDASQNLQVSNLRYDYDLDRGAGPEFQNDRLINSPASKFDAEQCRLGQRTKRTEKEHVSDRILKRKFLMDEDVGKPSSKTIMSRKLHSAGNFEGAYDSVEPIHEDIIGLHVSRTRTKGYGDNDYRKVGRTYDGQDLIGDLELDDWYMTQGSLAHSKSAPIRFYKNSGKFVKGNPSPGSVNCHTSHRNDRRSDLHKQNEVWKRNEDYDEDINANDGDWTEDSVNYAEAELSEDSKEFKQLVHEAFLKYSKKLNLNQSVCRRYKAQGHAGSLFCIVCGRRDSKEFMDTQRLVRHAFMSHKFGLRAQHLGLQKAICVLLGWNNISPPDTITWAPQLLPEAEAFVQKEDLVLWPPIVLIHNISMTNNNPQEQKVVPIEGVQAFLRGKGLVEGKISMCLGRPADQSIMVVKFLGTFTGLAMAERLDKYLAEKKRGRLEFQLNSGKICIEKMGTKGEKLEERLLYGYMAIAEDLEKLDFHNKKWSLIKSKEEILELANDPVKNDEK